MRLITLLYSSFISFSKVEKNRNQKKSSYFSVFDDFVLCVITLQLFTHFKLFLFLFFSFLFSVPASVNQLDNKTVVEGDSVFLNCNAMGPPDPFVVWSKIGGGVIRQDGRLNITNITKADRGQYQCFANNTCGGDVTFTSINVKCKILKWITL